METKIFGDKKIIIREITKSDMRNAKKFQDFINFLIDEDAKLLINKKATLKEEKAFLKKTLNSTKNNSKVYLIAEHNNKVVGAVDVELGIWRKSHIGKLGITIINGYRGIGLGTHLLSQIIKLAKNKLRPKFIQLEVYQNNKPAIGLYKKMGFKTITKIPKQIQYKGKLITEVVMMLEL